MTHTRSAPRGLGWPWVLVALLVGQLACASDPPERSYLEDFETLCDGVPCGWERRTGEPDQATWVTTIHPGEHALRLSGDVSVRGPGSPEGAEPILRPSVPGRIAARCDLGSRLTMDVVFVDTTTGGLSVSTRDIDPLLFDDTWAELSLDFDIELFAAEARVSAIVLTKTGSGACEIGEIVIDPSDLDRVGC